MQWLKQWVYRVFASSLNDHEAAMEQVRASLRDFRVHLADVYQEVGQTIAAVDVLASRLERQVPSMREGQPRAVLVEPSREPKVFSFEDRQ